MVSFSCYQFESKSFKITSQFKQTLSLDKVKLFQVSDNNKSVAAGANTGCAHTRSDNRQTRQLTRLDTRQMRQTDTAPWVLGTQSRLRFPHVWNAILLHFSSSEFWCALQKFTKRQERTLIENCDWKQVASFAMVGCTVPTTLRPNLA